MLREPLVAYPDPLTVSSELLNAEPVTSRADTLVLNDPLAVDNDPLVADNDPDVADNDPLVVDNDPLVADRDALVAYNEADVALYAPVVANAVLSKPSSNSALVAYDAEAIEPDIITVPVDVILQLYCLIKLNCLIMLLPYYDILINIKFPFLYNPPNGIPPAAAAASSAKFKLDDT